MRYEIRTKFKKHNMQEKTISFCTKKYAYRTFGWLERHLEQGDTIAIYRLVKDKDKDKDVHMFIAADYLDEHLTLTFLNYDPFNL